MISPLNFLAKLTAKSDFPVAVGPQITRILFFIIPIILHKATHDIIFRLPKAKMTERPNKNERSFQKAYGLFRRSGLKPLIQEAEKEEKPWRKITTLHLTTSENEANCVIQVFGQTTLAEGNTGNCSGIAILYVAKSDGNAITILSFDKPRIICGKKNGELKKEVLEASVRAAENPGIFMIDDNGQTISLIYRDSVRKASVHTLKVSMIDQPVED